LSGKYLCIAQHSDATTSRAKGRDVVFQCIQTVAEMNWISAFGEFDGECCDGAHVSRGGGFELAGSQEGLNAKILGAVFASKAPTHHQ